MKMLDPVVNHRNVLLLVFPCNNVFWGFDYTVFHIVFNEMKKPTLSSLTLMPCAIHVYVSLVHCTGSRRVEQVLK